MTPDSNQQHILFLLQGLSQRLIRVLVEDSRKFALVAQSPITIELYLAALYQAFPDEVARYFQSSEPLAKLSEELRSIDLSPNEILPAANSGDLQKILNVKIEDALVKLLGQVAEAAQTRGKGRSDLPQLMEALYRDDELTNRLRNDRNLVLRATGGS